jgi:hypothetical protein
VPPENFGQSQAVPDFAIASADIELVEETLRDDAVAVFRLRFAVAYGAFADLQAVNRLAFDHVRQDASGLAVTRLSALRCINAA